MLLAIDQVIYEQLCALDADFRHRWALLSALQAAEVAASPWPERTIRRYGVAYCTLCTFALTYCRCGSVEAQDADA
jgi:hypothetical protein